MKEYIFQDPHNHKICQVSHSRLTFVILQKDFLDVYVVPLFNFLHPWNISSATTLPLYYLADHVFFTDPQLIRRIRAHAVRVLYMMFVNTSYSVPESPVNIGQQMLICTVIVAFLVASVWKIYIQLLVNTMNF